MARPIFVVGCPRSGTTLLRDLLRSHPRLTFPPESHFIARFYRAYGDPSSDDEAWDLVRRILRVRHVRYWGIRLDRQDVAGCRSFREVTQRLFETWAKKEGKPRWGGKTPHYVLELPLLFRLFPDAQVIHIIRDARDVALSWVTTRFEPQNLYKAAALWRKMVMQGRADGSHLPSTAYLEIRYETLVAEPERTMRQVCGFLNEAFDPVILAPNRIPHEIPTLCGQLHDRLEARSEEQLRGLYETFMRSIVPDNGRQWKSSMTPAQEQLVETVAGDLLELLGYPVDANRRRLSRVARILLETDHQTRFLVEHLRRLGMPEYRRDTYSFGWAAIRSHFAHRQQIAR